jgi:adiponectin receptor
MLSDSTYRGLSRRRLHTTSYKESILSVATLHTETVNIWSHLIGTAWFCSSAARFAVACPHPITQDELAILGYLVAIAFCFACSTLYHIFSDHIHASTWQRNDHIGILCAVWSASVSFSLVSFQDRTSEGRLYAILVSLAATACLVRFIKMPKFDVGGHRARLIIHVALGGLAALPGLRFWCQHKAGEPLGLLIHFGTLVVWNSIGGGIYATKMLDTTVGVIYGVPDVSHHVMHIMVIVGACVYEHGLLSLYRRELSVA